MATPTIIIVGGGFGGLAVTKASRNTPANVILIDRTNHHLFQPLLYQVATTALTASQIATPIRAILRNQKNAMVFLGEVTGVDKEKKCVFVTDADRSDVPVAYDYLVLATGASHSYFGHDEFETFAPGIKTLGDAVATRNKILQAFELAEAEEDPARHKDLLTFVLVGAGPTGVEMAGALAVLVRTTLKADFRRINPASARIVLVDMAPRVLPPFSEHLSEAAKQTAREVRRGGAARTQCRPDRRGRRGRRRRAYREQNGHLDGRRRALARRQVVASRDRPCWQSARSKRPYGARTSRGLCDRRHSFVRGKR